MEREEFEQLGYWEQQVASSKLWDELGTPVYRVRDSKGRSPAQAQVRRTNWPGRWLYRDGDGYQVLEDEDVERWVLIT